MQHKIRTNYRNDSIATKVNTIINLINQTNEDITFDNTITNRFILLVNNKELVFHTYGEVINALKLVLLLKENGGDNMQKTIKSNCQGICPVCNRENTLEYKEPIFDNYGVYFPWKCLNCNSTGKEMYSMEFDYHSNIFDENGNEVKENEKNNY